MSIFMCAKIQKACIDEKLLQKILADFFSPKNIIVEQTNKRCVTYEGVSDTMWISFVREECSPYNVWDSSILDGEFKFAQLIIFDIKKEDASIDTYKSIVNFCIHLKKKIQSDILITSDVHNDVCFLKGQEVIWSQDIKWEE